METVFEMILGLFAAMFGFAAWAFGLLFITFMVCGGFWVTIQQIGYWIKNKDKCEIDKPPHDG